MRTTFLLLPVVCVLFSVFTNVSSLQCYQCENCTQVIEEDLITCGSSATTLAPTTTTSATTTTTTTVAPNTATTAASNTETTAASNTETTAASNTETTAASNTETTAASNTETTAASNTETTAASNTETTAASNTETTAASNTETTAASNTEITIAPDTNEDAVYQASRVRRAAGKDCVCKNGVCDCNGLYFLQPRADTDATYVCVKDSYTINGSPYIRRGCAVKHNDTATTCQTASLTVNCTICEKDKCNGSGTLKFSAVVLILSFLSYAF